jgi:hypothetical protein
LSSLRLNYKAEKNRLLTKLAELQKQRTKHVILGSIKAELFHVMIIFASVANKCEVESKQMDENMHAALKFGFGEPVGRKFDSFSHLM